MATRRQKVVIQAATNDVLLRHGCTDVEIESACYTSSHPAVAKADQVVAAVALRLRAVREVNKRRAHEEEEARRNAAAREKWHAEELAKLRAQIADLQKPAEDLERKIKAKLFDEMFTGQCTPFGHRYNGMIGPGSR